MLSESRHQYGNIDDQEPTDDYDQQGQEEEDGDGGNEDDLYASSGNILPTIFQ